MEMPIETKIEENAIMVKVTLIGDYERKDVYALMDTGFSSDIALDIEHAIRLGLDPVGIINIRLADGSITSAPTFMGKVKIGDKITDAVYIITGRGVLIGMGLLKHFDICFSALKNTVQISSGSIEGSGALSQLWESLRGIFPE
jgi:predicted aspartyl protease